ncbi:hypothetical protein [Breoghania sp. L-A4]|uniref:hypothetical protein n=1 Tax=Breoghania sp. L-A4 TaxID=2304600 RepID=UPI000E3609D5|nr:hypothetical protein [Breoghania sp. L-A4]AXS40203.1 hypothetical protein D1F64_09215 [Breoghania sp. L-A4]
MQKTVPTEQARQGRRGRPVLYVLLVSLFLCALFLGAASLWILSTDMDDSEPQVGVETLRGTPAG